MMEEMEIMLTKSIMIDFALCQHLYVKRQGWRISLALIFNSNNHIDCWGDYEDHKTTRTCRHGK